MATKKHTNNTPTVTADQLIALRDTEQQSWAVVAEALGLGSPGSQGLVALERHHRSGEPRKHGRRVAGGAAHIQHHPAGLAPLP